MEERERVKKLGSRFSAVASPARSPILGAAQLSFCVHCAAASCKSEEGRGRKGMRIGRG